MAWHDLGKKVETKKAYLARVKYEQIICSRASSFKDIVGLEIEEGTQYRIVTDMSFNAVTVIQHLTEIYKINEIYIAVYRMNNKSFDFLKNIVDLDTIKAGFILSTFFNGNKQYERWSEELKLLSGTTKNIRAAFCNLHAKVFLAKTECGKHIVFEGSGNLSHNEKIEQYIFENNQTVYEFHQAWIEGVLNNDN